MDLEKNYWFQILKFLCPEIGVKAKAGKIFEKHNPIEEYSVSIYETDPYFYEHYEKYTSW